MIAQHISRYLTVLGEADRSSVLAMFESEAAKNDRPVVSNVALAFSVVSSLRFESCDTRSLFTMTIVVL